MIYNKFVKGSVVPNRHSLHTHGDNELDWASLYVSYESNGLTYIRTLHSAGAADENWFFEMMLLNKPF